MSASLYDGSSKAVAAEATAGAPEDGVCGGKLTFTLSLFTLEGVEGAPPAAVALVVVEVFVLSFSFKLISDMVDVFAPVAAAANRFTSRAGVLSDEESFC